MTSPHIPLCAAVLGLAASACTGAPPRVAVSDAWCRASPPGAAAAACYVTLTATGEDRLVGAETVAAARTEIHTMSMAGGVMRMRPLDGLDLPRGKAVSLRPGGEHLMLISPTAPLQAGDTVTLTLRFRRADPANLQAPVRAAPGADAHAGHAGAQP